MLPRSQAFPPQAVEEGSVTSQRYVSTLTYLAIAYSNDSPCLLGPHQGYVFLFLPSQSTQGSFSSSNKVVISGLDLEGPAGEMKLLSFSQVASL